MTDLLSSSSFGNSQTDTKNSVGTQLSLVWGTVEVDQELINLGLILNIDVLLDKSWADDVVDVGNSLGNTLSSPLVLVSVTELNGLVLTWNTNTISLVRF